MNRTHLAILNAGPEAIRAHYAETAETPDEVLDLSGADLTKSFLPQVWFHKANFQGARFAGANLGQVNFIACNLIGADFCHANMHGATGSQVDFTGALFHGTNLMQTRFHHGKFCLATFKDTKLDGAHFNSCAFKDALMEWDAERFDGATFWHTQNLPDNFRAAHRLAYEESFLPKQPGQRAFFSQPGGFAPSINEDDLPDPAPRLG